MDLDLKGRRAIVTGATRGIGRAIAETLVAEGADIAICARHVEEVEAAVTALGSRGVRAFGGAVDIADADRLKEWIGEAAGQLGGLDVLVCNASALGQGFAEEVWQACFTIDVLGAQRAIEAALPHLTAAAEGSGDASVTVISSVSAAEASQGNAYGAMKAAQIHMVKGLAKQHAKRRVRFNAVSPGTVYFKGGVWNQVEEGMPDMFKATLARNPTGRMATPEEIAAAAVFLASPRSSFTTGVNLVVDGAITSRVNY